MEQKMIKKLHDRSLSYFGLNKDKLMAMLCHLDLISNMDSDVCVWPTETDNINAKGWQMGIFMRDTYGPTETGICFKDSDKKECMKICMHINEQLFGLDSETVLAITTSNRRNVQRQQTEHFDKALANIVAVLAPENLLRIPGVYEAVNEEFNNTAMDIVEAYNADPSHNNIDIKYTTKEMLEIMSSSLRQILNMDSLDLNEDQQIVFNQARESLALCENHLQRLEQILDKQVT